MKKFNRKGFTLVELLAVIALLAIVVSITIYVSINIINKSKLKTYEVTINSIIDEANNYLLENSDRLTFYVDGDIEYQCVSVKNLIDMGYFDEDIFNSEYKEGKKISENNYIYIEKNQYHSVSKVKFIDPEDGENSTYVNRCQEAITSIGTINISVNPSSWAKEKNVTITYSLSNLNDVNDLNNYKYGYVFDGIASAIDNVNEKSFKATKNANLEATIYDNKGTVVKRVSKQITKIDNVAPTGTVTATISGSTVIANVSASDNGGSGMHGTTPYGYLIQTNSTCPSTGYTSSTNDNYSFTNVANDTYYICVKLTDKADNSQTIISEEITVNSSITYSQLIASYSCANSSSGSSPYLMTYTGNCTIIDDGSGDWRVKFLTTGTLTFSRETYIDAFLVGGGGGGGCGGGSSSYNHTGGGGGYTTTQLTISLSANTNYTLTIGAGGTAGKNDGAGSQGGTTSGFETTALGGYGGRGYNSAPTNYSNGGSGGGNHGSGGSDGSNGTGATSTNGLGQGTTTREFGEPAGELYAGGGGDNGLAGGEGGGGNGASAAGATSGTANTGGGGGGQGTGSNATAGAGGSGVIVIRNGKTPITLTYNNNGGSGCTTKYVYNGNDYGELCIPSRSGYFFNGWYTEASGGTKITTSSIVNYTSAFTLYAHWIEVESLTYTQISTAYSCSNNKVGSSYVMTYTGDCNIVNDGSENWKVEFLTSGTLTTSSALLIDACLVGAGADGGKGAYWVEDSAWYSYGGNGGQGGGMLNQYDFVITTDTYEVVIGESSGADTTAFGYTALGGGKTGCNGGVGGSNYSGSRTGSAGNAAFETGTIYGGGGGAGSYGGTWGSGSAATGGEGGGATGGNSANLNTGGGGGGNNGSDSSSINKGGSGIVIIRNTR